jgi:hypothetical protein
MELWTQVISNTLDQRCSEGEHWLFEVKFRLESRLEVTIEICGGVEKLNHIFISQDNEWFKDLEYLYTYGHSHSLPCTFVTKPLPYLRYTHTSKENNPAM